MHTPPEVVFNRFLRNKLPPNERRFYKGKLDLDAISDPGVREMLVGFQEGFLEALRSRPEQPEYVPHSPIHFDYVESTVSNALAFRTDGFSFVGVTLPLIVELMLTCGLLSRSAPVGALLGAIPQPDKPQRIAELCRTIQLSFVFSHEYTHIVHGHIPPANPESMFADEIENDGKGNIQLQAQEVDADGYATFLVLNDLLNGPRRSLTVKLLGLEERAVHFRETQPELEDLTLFAAFVLAIGAYFSLRLPVTPDDVSVYSLTHPPQAVRMSYVMQIATTLAKHNRDHIASRMTSGRYQTFMGVIADALHGPTGTSNWKAQNAFLLSEQGVKYMATLNEGFKSMPSGTRVA
jgi:hypothetical protein